MICKILSPENLVKISILKINNNIANYVVLAQRSCYPQFSLGYDDNKCLYYPGLALNFSDSLNYCKALTNNSGTIIEIRDNATKLAIEYGVGMLSSNVKRRISEKIPK